MVIEGSPTKAVVETKSQPETEPTKMNIEETEENGQIGTREIK